VIPIPGMNDHHGALDEVTFELTIKGHADDAFAVLRMQLVEPLGDLYEGTFELVTGEFDIAPQSLLEQPACAVLRRAHRERRFHGVIRRVEDLGVQDVGSGPVAVTKRLLRVWLVPRLWLLSQRVDCRIYQQLTATEVFFDVIRRTGVYEPGTLDVTQMAVERAPIEYVVQYNESDLDFLRRLSQREGFWMRFVQGDDAETIALHDGGRETEMPDVATDDGMIVPVLGQGLGTAYVEGVRSVEWHRSVTPTRVVVGDHDLTRPHFSVRGQRPTAGDGRREVFRHPGPARFSGYTGSMYERDDAAHLAGLHYAASSADALVGEGTGSVLGFAAGSDFRLSHLLTKRYVLTHVVHEGEAPELLFHAAGAAEGERYRNTFRCLDATKPLALAEVTPKPLIPGPQTATVVGPPGEDIYTDEHGRIKVQFHWDRYGASDERSTCWLRAAQAWGGGAFGVQFIPRAGMEVVVCFLDGDPDRPLAIGCVYPQTYDWPFLPPGHKNRAGVRTNTVGTSPMERRYNELSFDDTPGHEEVFVHASRNLREEVVHDRTTLVRHDHNVHVVGVQSVVVEGKSDWTNPKTAATYNVTGDLDVTATGRIEIAAREIVLRSESHSVEINERRIEVTGPGGTFISLQTEELPPEAPADEPHSGLPLGDISEDPSRAAAAVGAKVGADLGRAMAETAREAAPPRKVATLVVGNARAKVRLLPEKVIVEHERSRVVVESDKVTVESDQGPVTLIGIPLELQKGPGLFAARMTDPAPAAILMGAALVQIGGPSFPLPVTQEADGIIVVGKHLRIEECAEDPDFQRKVLRDLGIMASTPSGLQRLQNIENNTGGHKTTIRKYTWMDAKRTKGGVEYGEHNSLVHRDSNTLWPGDHSAPHEDASGALTPNSGTSSVLAYNPAIRSGPEGSPKMPDATLFHELGHAEHNAYGVNRSDDKTGDAWHNMEEWQTIDGSVNQPHDAHPNDVPGVPYSPSENEYLEDRGFPYQRVDHEGGYE
jgi:type VI secretion system secreted protein VgrG